MRHCDQWELKVSLAEFRREFESSVTAFLWRQWAQLGVSGAGGREDTWAQDPEALLAATMELARGEPRLFDEVADWLALNEPRLSLQRFRNVLADDAGGSGTIAAGVCSALARETPGFSWGLRAKPPRKVIAEPLFDGPVAGRAAVQDEAFLEVGLVRGRFKRSHKSHAPVLTAPIGFAFRLREVLGVTARAEAVRVLLLHPDKELGSAHIAASSLFAKRNIAQALSSLAAAGVVTQRSQGRSDHWAIDRSRWLAFLDLPVRAIPRWVEWPALLRGLVRLSRWLRSRDWGPVSLYLQASEARAITGEVAADLSAALTGWKPPDPRRHLGEDYLPEFTGSVRRALGFLSGSTGK